MPITLDVPEDQADMLLLGSEIALSGDEGEIIALLALQEKYTFDKSETAQKLYATDSLDHPGVKMIMGMNSVLLAGPITLLKRIRNEFKEYEITPKQARRLFEERGWEKVVGFHTRNVIHRSHEFIQMEALQKSNCDWPFCTSCSWQEEIRRFQC